MWTQQPPPDPHKSLAQKQGSRNRQDHIRRSRAQILDQATQKDQKSYGGDDRTLGSDPHTGHRH